MSNTHCRDTTTTILQYQREREREMGGIPWSMEEDQLLRKCIEKYGEGKWHRIPHLAGKLSYINMHDFCTALAFMYFGN